MSKRFYSAGTLGIKVTIYNTCMGRYQNAFWEQLLEVIVALPENKQTIAHCIQQEDMTPARQQLKSVKHIIDDFAKTHQQWPSGDMLCSALQCCNLIPKPTQKIYPSKVKVSSAQSLMLSCRSLTRALRLIRTWKCLSR